MKMISLREFCLHPSKHIKRLPITLTQYNKPVAVVLPNIDSYKIEKNNTLTVTKVPTFRTTPEPEVQTEVQESQSEWPTSKYGKLLSGKSGACPVCGKSVPIEFATDHYGKEHGDI